MTGNPDVRSNAYLSFLTPRLRAAVQKDMAGSEVNVLDYDPICQCQDNDGLTMRIVSLRENSKTALATIESGTGHSAQQISLRLINTRSGWRLADIGSSTIPSLMNALTRSSGRAR
jgi:hypothetical protein